MTVVSTGRSVTDRPARYAKQLVTHMSRRHGGGWDPEAGAGRIQLVDASAHVTCEENAIVVTLEAANEDTAALFEDVIERHLVKFAAKDDLTMTWTHS